MSKPYILLYDKRTISLLTQLESDMVLFYLAYRTLSKILCKWKQDSVVGFFLYLDSVFKNK
ncbi:hypothetical protein, partial [Phocaeicola coprocola]|uniref:hypothetical protein n=1 Tax=Phocaeicola coprocola TaxID=310298 RepID=UPI001C38ED14